MFVPATDLQTPKVPAGPFLYGTDTYGVECADHLSWVAVYTKQHHEKRVAEYLVDQSMDCFLPLYTSERKWSNHRTSTIQIPLFPTYLFVRTSPRMRIRVLRTPGVIGIVGRRSADDSILEGEIEMLRRDLHLRNPEPHEFVRGERVRISAGPLTGVQGTIVRWKSSFRVVITVPMIQQSVSVEVGAEELEPVCR